jgi:zinc transport system permease protein
MTIADLLDKLVMYFQYPFVQRAMIAGVLIALCSSLLGVPLVLKRFSFIGDGLSHVAFGALSLSAVLNQLMIALSGTVIEGILAVFVKNQMLLVMPVTMLVAWLLLGATRRSKIMGDASLAMLSVGSLGLGYLLMNKFSTGGNVSSDVCSTLFGSTSILTLSDFDLWMCVVMSVVVIAVFVLFYNKIFAVTFDADFATATGTRAGAYNTLIALVTAAVIVLAMNLVGSLLISALVVFPALSAMRIFKSFRGVVACAAVVSVLSSAVGIVGSILLSTPVGSTIVVVQLAAFIVFSVIGAIKSKG